MGGEVGVSVTSQTCMYTYTHTHTNVRGLKAHKLPHNHMTTPNSSPSHLLLADAHDVGGDVRRGLRGEHLFSIFVDTMFVVPVSFLPVTRWMQTHWTSFTLSTCTCVTARG